MSSNPSVSSGDRPTDFAFFLGAGFTKAATGCAPVGRELTQQVFDECFKRPPSGDLSDKLGRFLQIIFGVQGRLTPQPRVYPRLEDVLSLLDFLIREKRGIWVEFAYDDLKHIRAAIIRNMVHVFDTCLRGERKPECGRFFDALGKLRADGAKVALVSTNYDLVADDELLSRLESCNYGFRVRRSLSREELSDEAARRGGVRGPHEERYVIGPARGYVNEGILHAKVHGSLNWLYCPRCDELDVTVGEKGVIYVTDGTLTCGNNACTHEYEALLVDPTMYKLYENRILRETREAAERALSEACVIVFIGYSLPDADYELKCMLMKAANALRPNSNGLERILVIDDTTAKAPDESESAYEARKRGIQSAKERYVALFGDRRLRFESIGLAGLADRFDELLPKLPFYWRRRERRVSGAASASREKRDS